MVRDERERTSERGKKRRKIEGRQQEGKQGGAVQARGNKGEEGH